MARTEYLQEDLLKDNPYLSDSEIETYTKELKKHGRFQTTTMKKIERIYKNYHYAVEWSSYGKKGKLLVGKKKPNPKEIQDNRSGNYTEYAEKGAKLLAHYIIYDLIEKNNQDTQYVELSSTRINWLDSINIINNYKHNLQINNIIEADIRNLTKVLDLSEAKIQKIIRNVFDYYTMNKNMFYREVFNSISNYLKNELSLEFDRTMYALFYENISEFTSAEANNFFEYYSDRPNAQDTPNGIKVKLEKEDREKIIVQQNFLRSTYNLERSDLIWRRNSDAAKKYFDEERRLLKSNFNIKQIWEEQAVSPQYFPKKFRYGAEHRKNDTEEVKKQLEKRWKKRLEKKLSTRSFENFFVLHYCFKIDCLLSEKNFSTKKFFDTYAVTINDTTKELVKLFGENILQTKSNEDDVPVYYKLLQELKKQQQ